MVIALPFLFMLVALMAGVPIGFALASAGIMGIWLVTGNFQVALGIVGASTYRGAADYILSTIPMFILMAYIISESGMARNLYTAAANWFSHLSGGLAIGTVFAGAVFGAMSGASTAAASVLSEIALPNMRQHKYSDVLSTGAIGLGATLSILIPPSVALVVYGIMTETSINKLLIAGIVPGAMLAVVTACIIWLWVRIDPSLAPEKGHASWGERFGSLAQTWPAVVLIAIMLVLLYSGAVTPSEVAALGATAALVIALVMRRLPMPQFMRALRSTIRTSALIFSILIGATVFGYFITLTRVPQLLVSTMMSWKLEAWLVMVIIVGAYFIISMFMDELPLLILTLPFTFPLVVSLGYDPVWFGIMSILMMIMGLIFPPVGMVAFVVSAVGRVDVTTVYRGTSVLLLAVFITTALIIISPEIALWLPGRMG